MNLFLLLIKYNTFISFCGTCQKWSKQKEKDGQFDNPYNRKQEHVRYIVTSKYNITHFYIELTVHIILFHRRSYGR